MSKHTTFRGLTIDMDSLRRENEKTIAVGNMPVNARGDRIEKGKITKTADQIARENHRVQSMVVNAGLKGPQPAAPVAGVLENKKPVEPTATAPKKDAGKKRERELPSGDIVMEDDNGPEV